VSSIICFPATENHNLKPEQENSHITYNGSRLIVTNHNKKFWVLITSPVTFCINMVSNQTMST